MFLSNGKSGQSPTLLPNFSRTTAAGSSEVMSVLSPLDFENSNPRVAATATVTVSGTIAAGDTCSITLTNPVVTNNVLGGAFASSIVADYVVASTDTLASVASALATLINSNATARFYDVEAAVSDDVITIKWGGPVGNFSTLAAVSGTSIVLTKSASELSGGSGPIVPFQNFSAVFGSATIDFATGNPYVLDYSQSSLLINQGFPIV